MQEMLLQLESLGVDDAWRGDWREAGRASVTANNSATSWCRKNMHMRRSAAFGSLPRPPGPTRCFFSTKARARVADRRPGGLAAAIFSGNETIGRANLSNRLARKQDTTTACLSRCLSVACLHPHPSIHPGPCLPLIDPCAGAPQPRILTQM